MDNNTPLVGTAATAEAGRSHLGRIFDLLAKLGGRTSPAEALEEDTYRIREGFHNFRLEEIEREHPETNFLEVPSPEDVQLSYFARTMQRTQLVGHFRHKGFEIPVHYSITGAIILERRDRNFHVWDRPALNVSVMLPFEFVADQNLLAEFRQDEHVRLIDTGGDRPEYTQLRIAAVRKAHELTMELRHEQCSKWGLSTGQDLARYLVMAGTVAAIPNERLGDNFAALASQVYVPWQNSELIEKQLLVPAYQRGQILRTINTQGSDPMPKYTWFIRLRKSAQSEPEFGLLRCTIIAKDEQDAVARADKISARLIDERLPVTFPAVNWDKLIFPLKLGGDYLDSLVATQETVKSYFARN
jgi:hypothetical protein